MDDFDTFDDVVNNTMEFTEHKIVIRVDKRNARKSITYLEGWNLDINELKIHLKNLKNKLGCNGSVKKKTIDGNEVIVFQLQGDKKMDLAKYLINEQNIKSQNISVIG